MNKSVVVTCLASIADRVCVDQRSQRGRLRQQRRTVRRARETLVEPDPTADEALEGGEDEGPVLGQRSAEAGAELIQPERLPLKGEGIARIEDVVGRNSKTSA
jgi:hypothetical protein